MIALCATVVAVVVADQVIKLTVRALADRYAGVLAVRRQIWLARVGPRVSRPAMWGIWMASSAVLLIAAFSSPLRPVPVGLIVGGSLSQALESALRGAVTDYGRTGTSLVFNVADMALLFGAVGLLVDGLTLVGSGRLSHLFGSMS